jgi:hypothetical protein
LHECRCCLQGLLAENVAANAAAVASAGGRASAAPLRWGDAAAAAALSPPAHAPWDVLLAADVVYRRELFAPLLATLRALAGPETVLVLAHLKRWGSERIFWRELMRHWTPRQEALVCASGLPRARGEREPRPVRVFTCRLRDASGAAPSGAVPRWLGEAAPAAADDADADA